MSVVRIVHLYAKEMNIYGDNGNVLVLQQRLAWRGISSVVTRVGVGEPLPKDVHLVVGGGGQDSGQAVVADDLLQKRDTLSRLADEGVPMLMICGMYQMFGKSFITSEGNTIEGIGIFDIKTVANTGRLIGNVASSTDYGTIVGYENHSGLTTLGDSAKRFGVVPVSQGNNGTDKSEGAVRNNVFGSYLHGPVLAKSPRFADHLLQVALDTAGIFEQLAPLDDSAEREAAKIALKRPR